MSQIIRVTRIFNTKNPLIKTLELRTTTQKPIASNPIGFFLQKSNTEERVAFHMVSLSFIERFGITTSVSDFNKAIGHECKIVVREGFEPMRLRRVNGELVPQEPKKVPGLPFDIYLCRDGRPIYRNTYLEVNPTEFGDVLISHDPISDADKAKINEVRAYNSNIFNIRRDNPNIMTEPTLD